MMAIKRESAMDAPLPPTVVYLRLIHRPAVGERDFFQVRIWIDGERVLRHGQHLAVPDRVAERAIGRSIGRRFERGANRLGFAGAVLLIALRSRFKPEVVALSEYLERDLLTLWGYDDVE